MAQQELNAIVTLRNEVSPWLMILQVVPDGWTFPDYVPGQFASLGLFGSASRCGIATPEDAVIAPDKLIQTGVQHRLLPGEPRVPGVLCGPRAGWRSHVSPVQPQDRRPHLAFAQSHRRIYLRRFASAEGRQSRSVHHQFRSRPVCQHAENAPEVPARAPGRPHPRCAKFVGLGLSIDPDGHGAPSHQPDLPARHQPAGGGAGSLDRCDGSRPGRVDEWGHRAGMGLPPECRKIRTSSSAAIQKWPNPQLRCSRERVSKRRRGRNLDKFM